MSEAAALDAQPIYPAPAFLQLDAPGARVKTACVDVATLPSHASLDALVPDLVADAGLALAPSGCGCDYAITFVASAPAIPPGAVQIWNDAGASEERYLVRTRSENGRAVGTLYAPTERGALYALRAALTLTDPDPADPDARRVVTGDVVDFPVFSTRGVVEGIYTDDQCTGTSMLHLPYRVGERKSLFQRMSRLRENTYIYAPKCDPYARAQWRTLYPPGSSDEQVLKTAIHDAGANLVDFVYGISPGESYDFASPEADFATLLAKIDSVRKLGVSRFALLLDDIPDHTPAPQVKLINAFDDSLHASNPDARLLVVGTTYDSDPDDQNGGGGPNDYTNQLGSQLHPSIEIMWTGPYVEPDMLSAADLAAVNASFQRHVTIWDNWPATSNGFTGRSADIPGATRGYFSNPVLNEDPAPMIPGEAPQVFFQVLGPIADYLWSPGRYGLDPAASFARWQALLPVDTCTPCGAFVDGWTCDASDGRHIELCDPETHCLSEHPCPGSCHAMPSSGTDDCR